MSLRVLSNLALLRRMRRWDRARVEAWTLDRMRRLVQSAHRKVPFYREAFDGRGIASEDIRDWRSFAELPVVLKEDIKANFPDRIVAGDARIDELHPIATSGTADRVMLFHDEHKRNWDRAADLLLAIEGDGFRPGQRRALIPPDACYERCGADEQGRTRSTSSELRRVFARGVADRRRVLRQARSLFMRDHFWRMKVYPSLGVDGTATSPALLDEYVAKLRRWRPRMLTALPVYLFVLARHLVEQGQSLQVPTIRPAGGKVTSEMIQLIEQAFGGRVRENFGTAELGTIGYDTLNDRRHRLLDGLFHIECLRGGVPVARGELGELVITDLHNHVAPLIRYAIGDVGRVEDTDDGVRFTVESRLDETVVMSDGRAVAGDGIVDFFLRQPGVKFVKVVQKSDAQFVAEIVPFEGRDGAIAQIELNEAFGRFLGCPVDLRLRMVRRVAPEPSGKYRLVVSSSYGRFHEVPSCDGAKVANHIDAGLDAISH